MNKHRVLMVADAIEKHSIEDLGFNMEAYYGVASFDHTGHQCQTTACIAGWANTLVTGRTYYDNEVDGSVPTTPYFTARDWLELTTGEADALFLDTPPDVPMSEVTTEHAVKVLRNFAETGKVDWEVGR